MKDINWKLRVVSIPVLIIQNESSMNNVGKNDFI